MEKTTTHASEVHMLPDTLKTQVDNLLTIVREDPEHHLHPRHRIELYESLSQHCTPEQHTAIMGWLAYFAAGRNIHLWDEIVTIKLEKYGMPPEEEMEAPYDPLHMHTTMLDMCEQLLNGEADPDETRETISEMWYIVGNEADEVSIILEEEDYLEDGSFSHPYWQAYDALGAALHAVHHALGIHFLNAEPLDDDSAMEPEVLDTAGLAMRAESSGDPQKRLTYWEWWLNEAVVQAWEKVTVA